MACLLRLTLTWLGLLALKGSLQDLSIYDDPAVAPHHCQAFEFQVSVGRRQLTRPCPRLARPCCADHRPTCLLSLTVSVPTEAHVPSEVIARLAFAC